MTSAWEADIALKFGIRMKWQMGMKRRREEEKKRRREEVAKCTHVRSTIYMPLVGKIMQDYL
jgi:hypothetical protein